LRHLPDQDFVINDEDQFVVSQGGTPDAWLALYPRVR
jgi:hypothetical protein